ncbi:hypothetical protein IFM51744_05000 [Aspergillus udagawae]|nr:hypothetical protein IFM51744_05000 [Aspergillus udagawae]
MHAQSILSLTLLAAIATVAVTEEVVTLFLPEFDSPSLVGKVIGTDGPLTTYVVNCNPKPKNQNFFEIGDCAASSSGFTIVHGPSTFRGVFEYPQYTMAEDCAISDSTSVSCGVTMTYGSSTSVGAMATIGPEEDMYQTLTITGTEIAPSSSGFTIVHGPSTFRGVFEYPQYTMAEDCAISDSTSVSCGVTMTYGSSTSVGAMATIGPEEDMYQTLTITGTEIARISATAQASTTPGTATATGSTSVTTTTGASTSAGETGKDTAAVSKSTNAAASQITGPANWVVGGAAAMAMVAAI